MAIKEHQAPRDPQERREAKEIKAQQAHEETEYANVLVYMYTAVTQSSKCLEFWLSS